MAKGLFKEVDRDYFKEVMWGITIAVIFCLLLSVTVLNVAIGFGLMGTCR